MTVATTFSTRYPIPHEDGQWFEMRGIGYIDLKAARDEKRRDGSRELRDMGGDIYGAMIRANSRGKKNVVDPVNTHDLLTLLDRAVTGWSYPITLIPRSDDGRAQKERFATLGTLDEKTVLWAARTIMEEAGVDNARGDAGDDTIDTESRVIGGKFRALNGRRDEDNAIEADWQKDDEEAERADPTYRY